MFLLAVAARNTRPRAPPSNTMDAAIWLDRNFIKLKNDLLEAQLDESRTKAELNRAQTLAANENGKFWKRANAELNNNNLMLLLQSNSQHLENPNKQVYSTYPLLMMLTVSGWGQSAKSRAPNQLFSRSLKSELNQNPNA